MTNIGICRLSSLGDVALSTVCLDLLSQTDIALKVYWVGMPPFCEILSYSPIPLEVVEIDPKRKWQSTLAIAPRLRHLHLFVDLQKNLRSQVLSRVLAYRYGIKTVSYDKERLQRWATICAARLRGRRRPAPVFVSRSPQHARMRATLARALRVKIEGEEARPRLVVKKKARVKGRIAIVVGASFQTKQAPARLWVEILQRVTSSSVDAHFYFFGTKSEKEKSAEIIAMSGILRVKDMTGELSLTAVIEVLASCAVLVGNDTGLVHIAEALGIPVAVLFGPTSEAFGFAPWRNDSAVFAARLGCRPCSRHGATPCRYGDKKCFALLDSVPIAEFVKQRAGLG